MNKYVASSLTVASVFALSVATGISASPDKPVAIAALPDTIAAVAGMVAPSRPVATADVRPDCIAFTVPGVEKIEPRPAYEIGDKLKIVFYELTREADNKWNKSMTGNGNGKNVQQRFAGEYMVQDDSTISVPLLGSVSVEGRNPKQLKDALQTAVKEITGRDGFVTIDLLERPPVYVLGPVKNAGAYKYASGMTVLHALALAGGIDTKAGSEPWQKIEMVREISKRSGSLESMTDLLVREAVLKSERDKIAPKAATQLVGLVGEERASRMISAEVERRMAIVQARRERDRAVSRQLDAAKIEIQDLQGRLRPFEAMIKLRQEKLQAYEALMAKGTLARTAVLSVQADVTDAEEKLRSIKLQQSQAEQRVAQLEQDKARMEAESRGDLDTAIMAISQQVSATARDADVSGNVLGALNVRYMPAATANNNGEPAVRYEVVRQSAKGPMTMAVRDVTVLRPGDLVKVVAPQPQQQTESPDRAVPVPASPTQAQNISATDPGCKPPSR